MLIALLLMALPTEVLDNIADPDIHTVTIPAGRYSITSGEELIIERDDLTIEAAGAVLVPADGVYLPVQILGGLDLVNDRRLGSGVITATTRNLTLTDVSSISPGDEHLIRFGVQSYDAQEPSYMGFFTVESVIGSVVTYTEPFGYDAPIFDSYDDFDPQKAGVWGGDGLTPQVPPAVNHFGFYQRGLGESHDVFVYSRGRPYHNITIHGLAIEWPLDWYGTYSWSFSVWQARNVLLRCCSVKNPTGSCMHLFWAGESGFKGFRTYGVGRSQYNSEAAITPAAVFTMWGGQDNFAQRLLGHATNTQFFEMEAGSVRAKIESCLHHTTELSIPASYQHFGVYANHNDLEVKRICLDVPACSLFPSAIGNGNFSMIRFLGDEFPGNVLMQVPTWGGFIRVGEQVFLPPVNIATQKVVSNRNEGSANGPVIEVPDGLYLYGKITVSTITGIESIKCIDNATATDNPLVFDLPANRFQSVPPGTYANYKSTILEAVRVWLTTDAVNLGQSVDVVFEGRYLPLET